MYALSFGANIYCWTDPKLSRKRSMEDVSVFYQSHLSEKRNKIKLPILEYRFCVDIK